MGDRRRVGPMVGKRDLTNEWRRAAGPGWALAGDAAIAADPVGAIGCGRALQSGAWLADAVAPALTGQAQSGAAFRAYRARHRRELLGHSLRAAESARSRSMSPVQRLLFSAAVHDAATAERIEAFAGRRIGPGALLSPRTLGRAAAFGVRPAAGA